MTGAAFLAAVSISAAGPAASSAISPTAVLLHPDEVYAGTAGSSPPTTAQCEADFSVACYQPAQIQQAYDLPGLFSKGITGKGETIIIVDSFGSPTIGHDLNVFDRTFGLPAPPSLDVIQPAGPVPPYKTDSSREGWAGETNLDVEWAHAVAPGASILLVETPTSENEGTTGFPQIVEAEQYVIDHHLGDVISQSFSATEQTFPSAQSLIALRGAYTDADKNSVTVLAASGDSGAADVGNDGKTFYAFPVTSWPDSDPLVTGVGGTQLQLDAKGNHTAPDSVWNDTFNLPTQRFIFGDRGPNPLAGGGGQSIIFDRPSYQDGVRSVVGGHRGVPDISMSAACNGGVDTYQSFAGQTAGWYPVCGTSEATPLFAGVVALADQVAGHPLGLINPALYALSASGAPGVMEVTTGNNTVSFRQHGLQTVTGFAARPGYDLASGVGTVDAATFVPELAKAAG
ncbi:MAG TPA: S53 family peptidase [Acidimicrobiales bacterium]|nr:S53 family peptidase [Acidimicrobiales bacterium]